MKAIMLTLTSGYSTYMIPLRDCIFSALSLPLGLRGITPLHYLNQQRDLYLRFEMGCIVPFLAMSRHHSGMT